MEYLAGEAVGFVKAIGQLFSNLTRLNSVDFRLGPYCYLRNWDIFCESETF